MRRRKECPYCGKDFDSLGIASHRAACREKSRVATIREHPILFNAEMVKAILDGRKTQTRRLMKPQPKLLKMLTAKKRLKVPRWCWDIPKGNGRVLVWDENAQPQFIELEAPYKVGDKLWVRETWAWPGEEVVIYRTPEYQKYVDMVKEDLGMTIKWTPSIHMPRWASRLTLEVTAVRCERIAEISEDDARAEGAPKSLWYQPSGTKSDSEQRHMGSLVNHKINYRTGFVGIWQSIYPGSWEKNQFVWVYEFKVIPNG